MSEASIAVDKFSLALAGRLDEIRHFAVAEVKKLRTENEILGGHIKQLETQHGVLVETGHHEEEQGSKDGHAHKGHKRKGHGHGHGHGHEEATRSGHTDGEKHRTSLGNPVSSVLAAVGGVADNAESHAKQIKEFLRKRGEKVEYDVQTQYKDVSIWSDMAKSNIFENVTLGVVIVNGLWIAVDVDYNNGSDALVWVIMDNLFCFYFTGELVIRFMAFEKKYRPFCDAWFCFDLALVVMMVFETWALPLVSLMSGVDGSGGGDAQVLRLLRLLRLTRMAKMMRSVPELMILIKGTVVGIRSVAITLMLLGGITFVFAIAMTTLLDGTEVGGEHFKTVPGSAYTLLVQGVIPDNGDLMSALGQTKWYFGLGFFVYIFLAALTFMNMLIGILCEAVHGVSETERESMDIRHMKDMLMIELHEQDVEFSAKGQMVTKSLFFSVMKQSTLWDALINIDVDIPSLIDNAVTIFDQGIDEEGLIFDDFIDVVLKFRATDSSMIKVIFEVRALVMARMSIVDKKLESIVHMLPHAGAHGRDEHHEQHVAPIHDDLSGIRHALSQVLDQNATSQRLFTAQAQFVETPKSMGTKSEQGNNEQMPSAPVQTRLEIKDAGVSAAVNIGVPPVYDMRVVQQPVMATGPPTMVQPLLEETRETSMLVENTKSAVAAIQNAIDAASRVQMNEPTPWGSPSTVLSSENMQRSSGPAEPVTIAGNAATMPRATTNGAEPRPDTPVVAVAGAPSVGASLIGRPFASPVKAMSLEESRLEESRSLLADEPQGPPNRQMTPQSQVTIPPLPPQEPPPEVTGAKLTRTPPDQEVGTEVAPSSDCYHYAYFDRNVPRQGLGFRVSWEADQPFACAVIPGGEADRQGVLPGDILAEINGVPTYSRSKDELFPLLSLRPLTVKIYRNSSCAVCSYYCLPDATHCLKCGTQRPACVCGSILLPDSVFCRYCGAKTAAFDASAKAAL